MRKFISTALAVAMLATSSVAMVGTSDARHRDRNHYYYDNHHRDHYYDRRHHRRDRGNEAGAAILGFALGAIVGSQANRGYSRDSGWDHVRRCESRYRSYDRYSDTFIGRDGRRYYCNL